MGGHGHSAGPQEPLHPLTAADEQYMFTPEGSSYEHTDANVWQIATSMPRSAFGRLSFGGTASALSTQATASGNVGSRAYCVSA